MIRPQMDADKACEYQWVNYGVLYQFSWSSSLYGTNANEFMRSVN